MSKDRDTKQQYNTRDDDRRGYPLWMLLVCCCGLLLRCEMQMDLKCWNAGEFWDEKGQFKYEMAKDEERDMVVSY